MDCRTTNFIEDYLDGMLDDATKDRFREHVQACPDCRNRIAREWILRDALKSMPAPIPDPLFADSVFECVASANIRCRRINTSVFMRLAASIIVIIALGFMFKGTWPSDRLEWPEAFVRLNQPEEIRLVFHSKKDLGNVTLRLEPPEGIELVGFENQREIVWQTNLVRGENLLVLPVIVRDRGGGSLITEIRHGTQNKRFGLRIKVLRLDDPRSGAGRFQGSVVKTTTI